MRRAFLGLAIGVAVLVVDFIVYVVAGVRSGTLYWALGLVSLIGLGLVIWGVIDTWPARERNR